MFVPDEINPIYISTMPAFKAKSELALISISIAFLAPLVIKKAGERSPVRGSFAPLQAGERWAAEARGIGP